MRKSLLIFIALITFSSFVFGQTFDNKSITQLTSLKKKAVSKQDYELAAKYKRAIELKKEISSAVKAENYQKAASLKKDLTALNGSAPLNTSKKSSSSKVTVGNESIFANTVYLHNNSTGENTKLEMQNAKFAIETFNAYWVAGSSSFWTVKGYYSLVQLTNKDDFTFIIKLSEGIDPASIVTMVKLSLLGKNELDRKQIDSKTIAAAYAGAQTSRNLSADMPISFKYLGDNIYEIVVNQMILPGEYAFKFGIKWYLFGTQDRISNNTEYPVTAANYDTKDFYHLPSDAPNISWLGIDCSLFLFRSNYNVGKEGQVKGILLDGFDYNRDKYMNHGKMESWFVKKHRMNYLPAFGYDITQKNLASKWIIPRDQDYQPLTKEQIEKHIKDYEINMEGIGIVLISEIIDRAKGKHHAYMVVFDFETREVLLMQKLVSKIATDRTPKDGNFAKDFLYITKVFVDRYYRPSM